MKDIDPSLYKLPPQNIEAEQSILGSILLENGTINAVQEILNRDDFYSEAHRKIFSAIERMADQNLLDSIGGAAYLASLVDNVPTAANAANYAKIVKGKSVLRGLIGSATEIINSCYDTGSDVDQVLDIAEHRIFEISENKVRASFYPIKDIVRDTFRSIEDLFTRKELITGVPTGFDKIDDMTSGLQNSDLIIVAGRPSMGKTALALNVAQHAALETQIPVAIFSLEMSKEQLAFRMLASEARVDSQRMRKGFLGETDWPKLTAAAGRLSEAPLFIDDTPAITVLEMKAKSRRLKAERDLGLIVVDYIQLMRSSGNTNSREQEISEISRSLKALAKELKVPVIALSQLNRQVETRPGGNKRPQMSDLRESGAIEQDADVIIFIYRDEVYNKSDDNPEKGTAEIIIGKQRNGPTGPVKLAFLDRFTTFENLARTDEP
jgi:replicative DNA helicase